MSKVTRAAFRRHLNAMHPTPDGQYTVEQSRVRRGARVRPYGDYLWHQDREKFEVEYQEWLGQQKVVDLMAALQNSLRKGKRTNSEQDGSNE
jgi:hypothetical protein